MCFNHTPAALIPALMLCAASPAGAQQASTADDQDGKPTTFRLTFADGQAYDFRRE